jgi:hypothetical protein
MKPNVPTATAVQTTMPAMGPRAIDVLIHNDPCHGGDGWSQDVYSHAIPTMDHKRDGNPHSPAAPASSLVDSEKPLELVYILRVQGQPAEKENCKICRGAYRNSPAIERYPPWLCRSCVASRIHSLRPKRA